MNIQKEIEGIWGMIQTDYEEELEKGVSETVSLFKQWALECVNGAIVTDPELISEVIRQRIEESTK